MTTKAEGPAGVRGLEIAPMHGLRYDPARLDGGSAKGVGAVTSPPYDVISPEEHRRYLEASPHNITRITLGSVPGEASSYEERGRLLAQWVRDGILARDSEPCFYAYTIDYPVPAGPEAGKSARFVGLMALGRLHAFSEGVILPHEKTFPKVVEDRFQLLQATRANLENILLLYSDPERTVEGILEEQCRRPPALRVEAKSGEFHAVYPFTDIAPSIRIIDVFATQRPIIADGHHRYTTSLRFCQGAGRDVPGAGWQMMTFANLYGQGLSILATHRLVKLKDGGPRGRKRALDLLLQRLERVDGEEAAFRIETPEASLDVRLPPSLLGSRKGVAATPYALLHDLVLGEWLAGEVDPAAVRYFKEGTGENEALRRGEGDLLFRMKPVGRREFESVVQGGEVFPHKTTYFYPKLWSGLVLWPLEEPQRLALK